MWHGDKFRKLAFPTIQIIHIPNISQNGHSRYEMLSFVSVSAFISLSHLFMQTRKKVWELSEARLEGISKARRCMGREDLFLKKCLLFAFHVNWM